MIDKISHEKIKVLSIYDGELIQHLIEQHIPVIVKDAVSQWPTLKKWDMDYLAQKIGGTTVSYKHSQTNIFPNPDAFDYGEGKLSTFNEFLNYLTIDKNNNWYFLTGDSVCLFENGLLNEKYSAIVKDVTLPSFIKNDVLEKVGLWVSKKDTVSSIHYDSNGCHNFNIQLKGSKEVTLFAPEEYSKMYFQPFDNNLSFFNFSKINWQKVNFEQFSLLKNVHCSVGTLETGDALFFPAFWIHYFNHIGNININLNFWWHPDKILVNPISIIWLLVYASAQMISPKHKMLLKHHQEMIMETYKNQSNINIDHKSIIEFAKELSKIFDSWNHGRPILR